MGGGSSCDDLGMLETFWVWALTLETADDQVGTVAVWIEGLIL